MRIIVLIYTIICSITCMGQDCNGRKFFNADGSQNAYFIDTIRIDSLVIVRSNKNGQYFAIKEPEKISLKRNIWNSPETYLYNTEIFGGWCFTNMPISAVPDAVYETGFNNGEKYKLKPLYNKSSYMVVTNYQQPKYYWLVMIRGDAYNYLTVLSVLDGGCKTIKFKDEKAYYKLLIPIWED